MTEPHKSGSVADEWIIGKVRFDQVIYDWMGIQNKLAGRAWLATWANHVYKRDRTAPEAAHKIFKWIAIDAAMGFWLEQKYPKFMERSKLTGRLLWPIYCTYIYGKNMASFNTLFLTGIDSTARGYVTNSAAAFQAMSKGEFPPPK
jgi:hypothetical protein